MRGSPLTLVGNEIKEGDQIPDCNVIDQGLNPIKLSSFKNKHLLLLTVPSLDTSVCSTEARRFNLEASKWIEKTTTLVISMDLPFAQKRWCGAEGIKNLHVLSDYQKKEVGEKFGVLIKELQLLARSVFIIDPQGVVRYVHLVKEATQEPPYETVIDKLKSILGEK